MSNFQNVSIRVFNPSGKEEFYREQSGRGNEIEILLELKNVLTWSPENPQLYTAEVKISGECSERIITRFAFRSISTDAENIYLNGEKYFFKGYIRGARAHEHLNNAKLGLKEFYSKNIMQAKRYGFNLIRFHSEIPPEECFEAADELGILIHIELRKSNDKYNNLKEMLYGKKVLITNEEIMNIIDCLYNHPSLAVYCIGNELRNPGKNKRISEISKFIHLYDGTRLFIDTCAHGEYDRSGVDFDVQHMSYYFPFGKNANMYEDTDNLLCFGSVNDMQMLTSNGGMTIKRKIKYNRPVIAHEVCHYTALRDFEKLKKKFEHYGTKKPWWIDEEIKMIEQKGFNEIYSQMLAASKYFQFICWKEAFEAMRVSRFLKGYHMLQLADTDKYENSNGVLDCFDDEQGVSEEEFLKFNGDNVIVPRLNKYIYFAGQTIKFPITLSKYGDGNVFSFNCELKYNENAVCNCEFADVKVSDRGVIDIVNVEIILPDTDVTKKMTLECRAVSEQGEVIKNSRDIWIYPIMRNTEINVENHMISHDINKIINFIGDGRTVVTDILDDKIFEMLDQGRTVILLYRQLWTRHVKNKELKPPLYSFRHSWDRFKPVIWDRGTNNGGLVDEKLLKKHGFETGIYIDMQYAGLIDDCDKINLDDFPVKPHILVRGIDKCVRDRFDAYSHGFGLSELQYDRTLRNFSYVFGLKAGKGKLLVTGFNFTRANQDPAVLSMFKALCSYAVSKEFDPSVQISTAMLKVYLLATAQSGPQKERIMTQYSAVALLMLTCDNEYGSEVYGCASDKNQASIVFDSAASIVEMSPELSKRLKVNRAAKRIFYPLTNSFYNVVSAEMVHGELLLTGLLYCGECGKKFTSHYHYYKRERKNGSVWEQKIYRYRCSSYFTPVKRKETCHQKTYRQETVDKTVIADAKNFVRTADRQKLLAATEQTIGEQLKAAAEKAKVLVCEKIRLEKEQAKLKEAVLKSLMGEGDYSAALLNEMLTAKDSELADITEKYGAAENIKEQLQAQLNSNKEVVENLGTWEARFDAAGLQQKKAILLNIIDKILVFPHGVRTEFKIETRGFGTLQAIDRPDWLSLPTIDGQPPTPPPNGGNGENSAHNNKKGQNAALPHAISGVNHSPQANKRIQMYKLLLHSDNKNHSDTKDRKRQIIFSRQKKRYLQCG